MASKQILDVSHSSYKDRMSIFHQASGALGIPRNTLHFSNDDERFWWDACSGVLVALLAKAGYDEQLQKKFLHSYRKALPALGPRPLADGQASRFSPMGIDSTPLGFSWNYDGTKSTIRYAFEPYGPPSDPFAQATTRRLVHEMAQLHRTKVDFDLFDAITQGLGISPENEANVLAQLPADPKAERPCHLCVGFDLLHDGSVTAKGYLTTQIKLLEAPNTQNKCSRELIRSLDQGLYNHERQTQLAGELIRSLNSTVFSAAPILPAYKIIEDFAESCPEHSKQTVLLVGWDCIKPLQSRLKIYVLQKKTSLRNLRDMWTQGGRLDGPGINRGLELIDELWSLIFCAPDDMPEDEELKDRHGVSQGIIGYLEIKPGAARPIPKLSVAVGKFGQNDFEIARKLADLFDKRGWQLGKTWVNDIQEIFSYRDLSHTNGLLTEFTFSPKEGGDLRVTMYMNPLIHSSLSLSS